MTNDPNQSVEPPVETTGEPTGDIVARAGKYYRNTRYIMFVLLVGMGGWFLHDGFMKYPRENAVVEQLSAERDAAEKSGDQSKLLEAQTKLKEQPHHTSMDILFQYLLGFGLPPLGALLLWMALHKSRGEYRLSGTKLSVPGHPTIDLNDIKTVNNDLWDRKGIVWLKYDTVDGQQGEIMLDDFLYERPPTDQIYDRIAEKFGLKEDDDEEDDEVESESESE